MGLSLISRYYIFYIFDKYCLTYNTHTHEHIRCSQATDEQERLVS